MNADMNVFALNIDINPSAARGAIGAALVWS